MVIHNRSKDKHDRTTETNSINVYFVCTRSYWYCYKAFMNITINDDGFENELWKYDKNRHRLNNTALLNIMTITCEIVMVLKCMFVWTYFAWALINYKPQAVYSIIHVCVASISKQNLKWWNDSNIFLTFRQTK